MQGDDVNQLLTADELKLTTGIRKINAAHWRAKAAKGAGRYFIIFVEYTIGILSSNPFTLQLPSWPCTTLLKHGYGE